MIQSKAAQGCATRITEAAPRVEVSLWGHPGDVDIKPATLEESVETVEDAFKKD